MAHISDLIIDHPEVRSYADFEKLIVRIAREGEIHLFFDIKPEYPDTPRGWEKRLELIFYQADRKKFDVPNAGSENAGSENADAGNPDAGKTDER